MSIYKQRFSKNWYARIYIRGSGRVGRKTIRVSTGTEDRQKAEAVAKTLELAHNGAAPGEALHNMIDQLLGTKRGREGLALDGIFAAHAEWIRATNKTLSAYTIRNRRNVCRRFADWAKVHYPAAPLAEDVDRRCALAFANYLLASGTRSKTRQNVVGELSAVWAGLLRSTDTVLANPWPLVIPQETDSVRLDTFSREEETRILEAADKAGYGWGLACRIARSTGLRYGDVVTLHWGDVDFKESLIHITPKKTKRHGIRIDMPMGPALAKALRKARPVKAAPDSWVLPELGRTYPLPRKIGLFRDVLAAAGVSPERHTFHSWRHTFRTRLAEAGVSDEIAKRLGGWTNDKTALHYDHGGRLEEMRAAVDKLGGA